MSQPIYDATYRAVQQVAREAVTQATREALMGASNEVRQAAIEAVGAVDIRAAIRDALTAQGLDDLADMARTLHTVTEKVRGLEQALDKANAALEYLKVGVTAEPRVGMWAKWGDVVGKIVKTGPTLYGDEVEIRSDDTYWTSVALGEFIVRGTWALTEEALYEQLEKKSRE